MKPYFIVAHILTILYAQSISLAPEFTYQYESDNEQYITENLSSQDYEATILGRYLSNKLNISARMGYHLINGIQDNPSDFTRKQRLHFFEQSPGIGNDQRNYYVADMKLQYGDSTSYFYINKWTKHWGPGVNSLIISNNIPSFFHIGFKWAIHEKIHFDYFHGRLKSGLTNTIYVQYYDQESRPFEIERNIVGHRLEWKPCKRIVISASELVTYANRSIEMTYLIPFVPFFPIQEYIGEIDNVIMSGDIQYIPRDNMRFYMVFIMDEWSPPYTFDTDNRNWFGWQTGFQWGDILFAESRFRMEYTWTDHRIYRHRFSVNDYYTYGYPIGFWAGPHAEELYIDYKFSIGSNHLELFYSNAKRGELTNAMLIDQYNRPNDLEQIYMRFSGNTETKQVVSISLRKYLTDQLSLDISYNYIDWKNAGNKFNSNTSDLILEEGIDLIKHSVGLGFQYRH